MKIDFGQAADDYARHRAGFPAELFTRLAGLGVGLAGQRVLDLGTGTGLLGRGLARGGAVVTGIDPGAPLLAQARRLDAAERLPSRYLRGRAEALPLADRSFEVVSAGQCWHWFDGPRAASEARRVLEPGGRLLIAYLDWLSLPGGVADATEALVVEHNPAWTMRGFSGIDARWFAQAGGAGFGDIESFSFDHELSYSHEDWRGRIRACGGVGASLSAQEVARFDAALTELLAARFPKEPLRIPHRIFALVARAPAWGPAVGACSDDGGDDPARFR